MKLSDRTVLELLIDKLDQFNDGMCGSCSPWTAYDNWNKVIKPLVAEIKKELDNDDCK